MAESTSSKKYDESKDQRLKSQPNSPTHDEMQHNPNLTNPIMLKMIESSEVAPTSPEITPGINPPSMNSGSPSNTGRTSGQ